MKHTELTQKRAYGFWNWGTGITLSIIVGAMAMMFLVYKTMGVQYDMAEDDYYAAELKQNDKVTAVQNAYKLSSLLKVELAEGKVVLQFPAELINANPEGIVKFYRPSDINLDRVIPLQIDEHGRMAIAFDNLQTGNYQLQVAWTMNQKDYFVEQSFYLP